MKHVYISTNPCYTYVLPEFYELHHWLRHSRMRQPVEIESKSNLIEIPSSLQNLRFRRQFLISPKSCDALKHWKQENLDRYYFYAHPDCQLVKAQFDDASVLLIGHVLNPHSPDMGEQQIADEFAQIGSLDQIQQLLYPLVGRFVLIVKNKDGQRIYHDACGLKSVYYTYEKDEIYVASQPSLLKLVVEIKKSSRYSEYFKSKYVKSNHEHFVPAGISLYEGVGHLVPNHFLDITLRKQVRYWPIKKVAKISSKIAEREMIKLLSGTMRAAGSKYELALPLTAGLDTRLILAAAREIKNDVQFYTLKYRNLTEKSPDLSVPAKIASALDLKYKVIDCSNCYNDAFLKIYAQNSDTPHVNDWGTIALGMYNRFHSSQVAVKGNCIEIVRGAHLKSTEHPEPIDMHALMDREYLWDSLDFIKERMVEWHGDINSGATDLGYDELDLFYMEHRMGNWQAQSQLEWDIVQEAFTPFNNRELIDLILGVPIKYRMNPDCIMFKSVIRQTWPELLQFPINPKPFKRKVLDFLNMTMRKTGMYQSIKKIVKGA